MPRPIVENISIEGPVGPIEASLSYVKDNESYIAVVCHPHPLYGGTMNNKVVHYTLKTFNEMGIPALKFNFRGVGASGGSFDHAIGEVDDLGACVSWLRSRYPKRKLLLGGFSFGAYIVAKAAASLKADGLVTIAPAVNLYDFGQIEDPKCPWLLIQGDADEVVPVDEVRRWLETSSQVTHIQWMPKAEHFFHGRLIDLSVTLKKWLSDELDLG